MRLIMVLVGVGALSLGFSALAISGFKTGLCQAKTEEAIRFVERFLDSAPTGFEIEPIRQS